MHACIPYFPADIATASSRVLPLKKKAAGFEEELAEIAQWAPGEEQSPCSGNYCGPKAINFTPPGQLTDAEMKQANDAPGKMNFSRDLDTNLAEKLPPPACRMTVDTLHSKSSITSNGITGFYFCTGYSIACVCNKYCLFAKTCTRALTENELPGKPFSQNAIYY